MLESCKQRATLGRWRLLECKETFPVKAYHREDGAKLYDEGEGMHEGITLGDAQEILCNNHVACRRHWQKLCQALNNGNDDSLYPIHSTYPLVYG